MGKHIDKLPYDGPAGTRTLPVLLGEGRAKAVTQGMMIAFYVGIVALVAVRALPWPALLIVLAVPLLVRTLRAFNQPRPTEPPRRLSRCGRCGGRRSRSCTPGGPVACSSAVCCSGCSGRRSPDQPLPRSRQLVTCRSAGSR